MSMCLCERKEKETEMRHMYLRPSDIWFGDSMCTTWQRNGRPFNGTEYLRAVLNSGHHWRENVETLGLV